MQSCPFHHASTGFAARSTTDRGIVPRLSQPALQQTIQFFRDPMPLIERGRAEHGDIFSLRVLGFGEWVFVCSPEGVEEMVRTPSDALVAGEMNQRAFAGLFTKDCLITLDGQAHLDRRRLMLPFFQEQHVAHHLDCLARVANRVVDSWPIGEPFAMLPQMQEISFQIIMETVFGFDYREQDRVVKLLRRALLEVFGSTLLAVPPLQVDLGRFSPWGRLKRLHAEVCAALDAQIERRRRIEGLDERQDVCSRLLVHQRQHPGSISDRALREELLLLLAAGFETSALLNCWVVECALSYPETLDRVRAEVKEVKGDASFEREHLAELEYLEALVHESARHRMPAPFAGVRIAKKPLTLLGHRVPEGALVSMGIAGLAMREEVFPEPHRFRPERFLERKPSAYEWNPFGSGTRQCVGKGLAMAEVKVALSTVFTRTRLRPVDALGGRERAGLFFAPRNGLRVVLEERF